MSTSFYVYETQYEPEKGAVGMREIKFRYKFKKNNEIKTGFLTVDELESEHYGSFLEWEDAGFQLLSRDLFTGLKDKNGAEIYEGDVYKYIIQGHFGGFYQEFERTAVVYYEDGAFCVGDYLLSEALEGDDEAEIISNIHENPELLEVPT